MGNQPGRKYIVHNISQSAEENEIVAEMNSEIEEGIRNYKRYVVTDVSAMRNQMG